MSRISLSGNPSGTGTFTIASPNSNSDRTVSLPDASGTVQLSGAAFSGTTGTFSGIIQANGGGVEFPATQVASSNANTLDDYEEGTWTIGLRGSTTAGSYTVSGDAKYTKIGNVVTVTASINALTVNSAGSGYAQITGLPFTKATGSLPQGAVYLNYVAFPSGTDYLTFSPITGSATDTWYFAAVKSGTVSANTDISSFSGSTTGFFSATYFAS